MARKLKDVFYLAGSVQIVWIGSAFAGCLPNDIEVPYRDARDNSVDAVQAAASGVSKNSQTLILYAPNPKTFDEVTEAAQHVLAYGGTALNGVILAQGQPSVAFYADSLFTGIIKGADQGSISTLSDDIVEKLRIDYQTLKAMVADGEDIDLVESVCTQ